MLVLCYPDNNPCLVLHHVPIRHPQLTSHATIGWIVTKVPQRWYLTWSHFWCACDTCHRHVNNAWVMSLTLSLCVHLTLKFSASGQRRCRLHTLISPNTIETLQHVNLIFPFGWGLRLVSVLRFLCMGPVANQSLSFCLAVMHTNSQQHILISPEFKAHQSQLTGPPGPPRAILKKNFIMSVRHVDRRWWLCTLCLSVSPPTLASVPRV